MAEQPIILSALPPSRRQVRLALALATLLGVTAAITLPFASVQLATIGAYVPTVGALLCLSDLITAALLFSQFSISGRRALLALASGYLFTAMLIAAHGLSFPGGFSDAGLLGNGLQTTTWLYIFWHLGLPIAATVYALLKSDSIEMQIPADETQRATLVGIAGAVLAGAFLIAVAIRVSDVLPHIMLDRLHVSARWIYIAGVLAAIDVAAFVSVWRRRRSVLDLWLLLVLWSWLMEIVLIGVTQARYSLVWYMARIFGLASASTVLFAILSQTMGLYARLARAMTAQHREQDARLLSIDAALASVAHQVYQPVSAIVTNAASGLRTLAREEPDRQEIEAILTDILADGRRVGDAVSAIRAVFRRDGAERSPVDIPRLVDDTLVLARSELQAHKVAVETSFDPGLPPVEANRGQLQQMLLNLIANATEAMDEVTRPRLLRIGGMRDGREILVSLIDTGKGIDPRQEGQIFDPFFTTKPRGMGLGLAICRSIIEAHSGRLRIMAAIPHGTVVQFTLPAGGGE